MIAKSKSFKIEYVELGLPLAKYPIWFHMAISKKKMLVQTELKGTDVVVTKVIVKNVYGGNDQGLIGNDVVCKGVKNEIFVLRKILFNAMFEPQN